MSGKIIPFTPAWIEVGSDKCNDEVMDAINEQIERALSLERILKVRWDRIKREHVPC